MKRQISIALLLLALLLSACEVSTTAADGIGLPDAGEVVTNQVTAVESVEIADEAPQDELPVSTVIALVVIVVVLALGNERLVEAFKKIGLIKQGQSAAWQSIFGALAIAALALAKHLGLEGQITEPVNNLVQVATAGSLLILAFGQAGLAKILHELWRRIGWVTTAPQAAQLKPPTAVDRG